LFFYWKNPNLNALTQWQLVGLDNRVSKENKDNLHFLEIIAYGLNSYCTDNNKKNYEK